MRAPAPRALSPDREGPPPPPERGSPQEVGDQERGCKAPAWAGGRSARKLPRSPSARPARLPHSSAQLQALSRRPLTPAPCPLLRPSLAPLGFLHAPPQQPGPRAGLGTVHPACWRRRRRHSPELGVVAAAAAATPAAATTAAAPALSSTAYPQPRRPRPIPP